MTRIRVQGRLVAAACTAALIWGCSGGTGASSSTAAASGGQSSGDVLKTSFSFVFDGKLVSGTDTDMTEAVNVARHKSDGLITFELNDITHYPAGLPHLHFTIADRGTTTITGTSDPRYSVTGTGRNNTDQYQNDEMTVTITSNTAARVAGTFSGRVIHASDDDHATAAITDGKFDLPYATRSK